MIRKTKAKDVFDELVATDQLLTALEYDTRKEEHRITEKLFEKYNLKRTSKEQLSKAILDDPGFETFFLDVMSELRPFALMVQEVYLFLSSYKVTAERRASLCRVSGAKARRAFDFNLDHFPKELLHIMGKASKLQSIIRLQYTDNVKDVAIPLDESQCAESVTNNPTSFEWDQSETQSLWKNVSPRWDGDFYDDGFHRTLSYAATILNKAGEQERPRVQEIVEPIIDRLKALIAPIAWEELDVPEHLQNRSITLYMGSHSEPFEWEILTPKYHVLDRDQALAYFKTPVQSYRTGESIWDIVIWDLISMSIAVTMWDRQIIREDRNDWLAHKLEQPFDTISADKYLALLKSLAVTYTSSLDSLVPVVEKSSVATIYEYVMEFLQLPFWKDRWFLYELWTLCFTLNLASNKWPVELRGIETRSDGVVEWKLPGGIAKSPVAVIGVNSSVECWTQRKTYHPESRKGLEPDLRLTKVTPGHQDLFIVENKDRRKPSKGEISEILYRYTTGTFAKCVCVINYDEFTGPTHDLMHGFPDRQIQVYSSFKPLSVPSEFCSSLLRILDEEIENPLKAKLGVITASLTWTKGPADLDLHAWITRTNNTTYHISYSESGQIDSEPFAKLDRDDQSPPGREAITVSQKDLTRLVLAVHRYSSGNMADSDAQIQIQFGDGDTMTISLPESKHGEWWHLIEFEANTKEIRVIDTIMNKPPLNDLT